MGKRRVELKKCQLFEEEGDNVEEVANGDDGFRINSSYAQRYDEWRRLEEMQKLKDKYGKDAEKEGSDAESTSSEEPEQWTGDDERRFLETLGSLKGESASIYDPSRRFFEPPTTEGNKQPREEPSNSKQKQPKQKQKVMTLKDYERKLILDRQGKISDDSGEEDNEMRDGKGEGAKTGHPSYHAKQQKLLDELKAAIGKEEKEEAEEDGFLTKRYKTRNEEDQEESDFYAWLADKKDSLPEFCQGGKTENGERGGLQRLKQHWTRDDLDEDERFLRDYLINKEFETDGRDNEIPTYNEIVALEEDEQQLRTQADFEHKYNHRFEEPDQDFIKQYPRTVTESLRQDNSKRKDAREKQKERKKREKDEKIQELKELKRMKKSEIENRLEKLSRVAGCAVPLTLEELEADYDPQKFDKKMAEIFNKEYYEQEEEVKDGEEMVKPVFSDDEEENMSEDESREGREENEDSETEAASEEPSTSHDKKAKQNQEFSSRKRKRQEVAAARRKRPLFDPSEKSFDEYLKEYYALDFEDVIGDQTVKFKYRQVLPNDFGLSTDEIVRADDRQLNAWASLRKITSYRAEEQEKFDLIAYKKKAQNVEKKQHILTMNFGGIKSLLKKESGKSVEKQGQNGDSANKPTDTSSRKRRRNKQNRLEQPVEAAQDQNQMDSPSTFVPSTQQPKAKRRRLKKGKSGGRQNYVQAAGPAALDDSRLAAYGLNPKKFKQALKYGKKKPKPHQAEQ